MQCVYFDLNEKCTRDIISLKGLDEKNSDSAIHNREDIMMSPTVMWSRAIEQSKTFKELVVVCNDAATNEYEAVVTASHVSNVHIIPLSQTSESEVVLE